jgi:pimeloyl-ACP methyl ester carboxylesterase
MFSMNRIKELRSPTRSVLLREARVIFEIFSLYWSLPGLRKEAPKGQGQPVLVVPGFVTEDWWTAKMRSFLASIGYQTRGCEFGRITGDVSDLIPMLGKVTEQFFKQANAGVRLVGWSLGGYLAREVARERPDRVEKVITLGTPVIGGPKYTASARILQRRGYDIEAMAAEVRQRQQTPIAVPIAAIFSRIDGVVAWEACIDEVNPNVEHLEVVSSHLGLLFNPDVYRLVAKHL